jgi:hypothetical protein
MPYTFSYTKGQLAVRFAHGACDDIDIHLRLGGQARDITEVDYDCEPVAPTVRIQEPSIEYKLHFTSVYCPFTAFVQFLEAITTGVEECAFSWEGEGPHGTMRWHGHGSGSFTVHWHDSVDPFRATTTLDRREVVAAFYRGFRSFVNSADYDPLRYERLDWGDLGELALQGESRSDVANAAANLTRNHAWNLLWLLHAAASSKKKTGVRTTNPLSFYLELAYLTSGQHNELDLRWQEWGRRARQSNVEKFLQYSSHEGADGVNLRQLRSLRIEEWLAAAPAQH